MCQNPSRQETSQVTADPGAEAVTMTVEQLEEFIEALVPSGSEFFAGLAQSRDSGGSVRWEKCTPCIAGFKACLKCTLSGCKVRIRSC